MQFNRIDIVSIPVSNQQRAKAFYVDILGFQIVRENPMGPGQNWVELEIPNTETSITLVTWFDSMPAGCVKGLVLDTSNIEQTKAELTERGLTIPEVQNAPWGNYFTIEDPDGNGLVVQQSS